MTTGKIGVTTENIFPVIKKFLYSDHEIFLRELVSNAVDAIRKLRTLSSFGDFKGELGDMRVYVKADKEAGTLTVSDHAPASPSMQQAPRQASRSQQKNSSARSSDTRVSCI